MNKHSILVQFAGSLAALALAVGCSENSKSSPPAHQQQTAKTNSATPAKPEPAPVAVAPAPAPAHATAPPKSPEPVMKPVAETPQDSLPPFTASNDDERREQAANLIYAQIRVKMEEAIDERAKLLKSGTDPSDTKVRELEGRIMRARELLMGNGELVEEVEPPIVQKNP